MPTAPVHSIPLIVDLDGTLVRTDMLHETSVQLFRTAPFATLGIPLWLGAGKAALKREIAQRTRIDPALLPYNEEFLAWLREQQRAGRRLILCTASHISIARSIAAHCGIFDDVMASDGLVNLGGERKAKALVERFGERGFDYAGNANVDLAVWARSRKAVVVNAPAGLERAASQRCEVEKVFAPAVRSPLVWAKALRVHQWLKNVLLFVPLFAAHRLADLGAWVNLLLAFAAFSLCASSVYVANDLMDLESDRLHPRKRKRPFASGALPVALGVVLVPILALASLVLSLMVEGPFLIWLTVYFAVTWAYSWWLKRAVLIDCLTLATLYTLRILAGSAAAGLVLSFWLLAFSGFLFLSLAFLKRYAELRSQLAEGKTNVHGRGYFTSDAPLIGVLGVVSGYISVVVFALYLNSDAVLRLYRAPQFVWGAVPVLVWWISWMWLRAFRDEMHDDPLVFAFRDKPSLAAGALFGAAVVLGSAGVAW